MLAQPPIFKHSIPGVLTLAILCFLLLFCAPNAYSITTRQSLTFVVSQPTNTKAFIFTTSNEFLRFQSDPYLDKEEGYFNFTSDIPLPDGLTLDANTGIITGIPLSVMPRTRYTFRASQVFKNGGAGLFTGSVWIEVLPATLPPNITYNTPLVYKANQPVSLKPTNTGGEIISPDYGPDGFSDVRGELPYGLTMVIAGSITSGNSSGIYEDARFNQPYRITKDHTNGNMYATDRGNNAIRKIVGQTVTTLPITGLNQPSGITAYGDFLYIADAGNNTIKKFDISNYDPANTATIVAGNGIPGFADGPATTAQFNYPTSIVAGPGGILYVADSKNNRIRKIDAARNVTTIAGDGAAGFADGPGATAQFNNPTDIAIDAAGNLYVADAGNNRIRKITPAGIVSTVAGNGIAGNNNGSALAASFNNPMGVTVGAAGEIFVADTDNGEIKRISSTGVVTTLKIGQNNVAGFPLSETMNRPSGVFYDTRGFAFVTDVANNRVLGITTIGYTIDKPLPNGLKFDPRNGEITGIPVVASPATDYTVTVYNTAASSTTVVNITVLPAPKPSIITFPSQVGNAIAVGGLYDPRATSTNTETAIQYVSSSNNSVAVIEPDGTIRIVGLGTTTITALQPGNANYSQGTATTVLKVQEEQTISFPQIPTKVKCDADFLAGATSNSNANPITYTSSNTSVATVNSSGLIHIVGSGTTTITANQPGSDKYIAANPVSQQLTVTAEPALAVSITADKNNAKPGIPITFTAIPANSGIVDRYQWKVNGTNVGTNSSTYTGNNLITNDKVTCTVTSNVACAVPATSNVITITHLPIAITNTFTPNGDGINDTWNIPDLTSYTDCLVSVYARNGQLVFQSRGYTKAWDGTRNGQLLPFTTYYYILSIDGGKGPSKLSGTVTIVR